MRVHALGRSRALSVLVLVLALVPVVFDMVRHPKIPRPFPEALIKYYGSARQVLLTYMHPAIDPAAGCLLDSSRVPFELYEMCVSCTSPPMKYTVSDIILHLQQ